MTDYRFLVRGGTATALATLNETTLSRELCFALDAANFKLGDGATLFNNLPWMLSPFAAASGTNTITATFTAKPVLFDGLTVYIRAAGANTGAVTFNPNSLGALSVTKLGGTALVAGDIAAAGHELILRYRLSATRWELLNPASSSSSGQAAIQFKDEGTNKGGNGLVTTINFTGSGVSVTEDSSGTVLTVAVTTSSSASAGYQIGYTRTTSTTTASTTSTTLPFDNTIPQNTEGVAYTSLDTTYTPVEAASKLRVRVYLAWVSANTAGTYVAFALFRDSTANAIFAALQVVEAANGGEPTIMDIEVPANAASATTFKLRWGVSGNTGYILRNGPSGQLYGGTNIAFMEVTEIKQ